MPVTQESLLRSLVDNSCTCVNCDNDSVENMTYAPDGIGELVTCNICKYSWRATLTTVVIDQIRDADGILLEPDLHVKFLGANPDRTDRFTAGKRNLLISLMAARLLVEYFKNPSLGFSLREKSRVLAMMDKYLPMVDPAGMTPEKAFELIDSGALPEQFFQQ